MTDRTAKTRRGQTLLKGHTLRREGKPFHLSGYSVQYSTGGHARCSCGEYSAWLNSDADRKRWHAVHKEEIRGRE